MERGQKAYEVYWRALDGCEGSVTDWQSEYVREAWAAVEAACVPAMPADVAALVERLEDAYRKVAKWPEARPEGISELLQLRNMVPDAASAIKAQAAEIDRLREERDDALSTLSAWFDLSKKAEAAGASILEAALDTWLCRAASGGMPAKHADIVRNVVDDAARLYLWNALVPVLRTITDERAEAAEAKLREAAALLCTYKDEDATIRAFLSTMETRDE